MAILTGRRARKQQQVVTVEAPVSGPGYAFEPGEVLIVDGPLPSELAPACAPHSGVIPPRARQIDAVKFAEHVERERRIQQLDANRPKPETWARGEVVRRVFRGDAAALDEAEATLGFPKPTGFTFGRNGRTSFWKQSHVEEWVKRVRQVADALGDR